MEGVIHLISGLVPAIILLLFRYPHWTAVSCVIGGILPDLIDKPLSWCMWPYWLGRSYAHTLIFVILVLTVAVWYCYLRRSYSLIPLVPMVALHHAMDAMWQTPSVWFYPLYGPIPTIGKVGHTITEQLAGEINNPNLLLSGVLIGIFLMLLVYQRVIGMNEGKITNPS